MIERVEISTIVDNDTYKEGFGSDWGLSFHARITYGDNRILNLLFDVDTSYHIWRYNYEKLGLGKDVEAIIISHWHMDHVGPLWDVLKYLGTNPTIYAPESPGLRRFRDLRLEVCSKPCNIAPEITTTGQVEGGIPEQALAIKVGDGLVVLVGCSHPGVDNLVEKALEITGLSKVHYLAGGFHISSYSEGERVAHRLKELGVEKISPMHCTGWRARSAIKEIFKENYITNGSGQKIIILETGITT